MHPSIKYQTSRQAYKYLTEHPGQVMHYADVADAIGLTKERVNAALTRMVLIRPEYGVSRVSAGHYIYRLPANGVAPEALPEPELELEGPRLYEEIGRTRAGTIIVRDEDNTLYTLGDVL